MPSFFWTQKQDIGPSARSDVAMTFDEAKKRAVLFGGTGGAASLFNDTWDDWSWNAVWQSDVSIDEGGWSVEMRIPLSQLRFTSADKQTWGINVERYIRRRNEGSWLEMVPKKETGRASRTSAWLSPAVRP